MRLYVDVLYSSFRSYNKIIYKNVCINRHVLHYIYIYNSYLQLTMLPSL